MATTALELHGVSKTFGATRALRDVDLTLRRGEVLALLGENGCGKSTLVKVLAGVHVPEPGSRLVVDGREIEFPLEPGASRELGISFVHQDLGLAKPLTVLENLMPGRAGSRWHIGWRAEHVRAREMLGSYGIDVDPAAVVDDLPPVEQALVAIARAAEELERNRERNGSGSSVLVLDEPTVFLPEEEVRNLFDLVRRIVASGASVVFISHDLPAVREIADRVVVLRDGQVAADASVGDVTDTELVEMIVGAASPALTAAGPRERPPVPRHGTDPGPDAAAELLPAARPGSAAETRNAAEKGTGMSVTGLSGGQVRGLGFSAAPGEVVGLAGLLGSGAEDVPYLLFGARPADGGELSLDGRRTALAKQDPGRSVGMRIGLIPADRRRDAIAPGVSVAENMMLLVLDRFRRASVLRPRLLRRAADERAEALDVRPRRTDLPIGTLSGGNAQKAVVSKWLEIAPQLLLLHEPTQGVDVGARAEIYRAVRAAGETGMTTLWVSSDFDELATVCDRVLVVSGGVVADELSGDGISPEAITTAVYGAATSASAPSPSNAVQVTP